MKYAGIAALVLVLGTWLPSAFSDDTDKIQYTLGSSTAITTSQGLVIQLQNVTDSRCPSDVTCIWAGQVNVTLTIQSPTSKGTISLAKSAAQNSTTSFDNYVLQLVDVKPYPQSGQSVSLSDYIVTLNVSQASEQKIRLVSDNKLCLAGVDTCVMAKRLHLAPLKQIRVGIGALDVSCKDGYGLVLKSTNNMPSCVKPSTADDLVKRGWALSSDEITKLRSAYEP
ncbi:MAG: hypothetical protein KGH76_00625 [Thaumarchaeota archaeon]|nr:hypothetical protein [Nitrososphaerota archaeon]